MTEVAALGLRVDGVGNIDAATSSLGKFTQAGQSAEKSADNLGTTASNTTSQLKRLAVAAAAGFSVRQLQQYADTWSDLSSLVKVNIGAQDNAADVMRRLSDIARQTYSSLELTAQGFTRNAFVLNALGISTQDQLNYTEALNNALVVSGAKGERAALVQNALSRAMAEGAAKGDDLNLILNYGSRVAELLAKELNVDVTALRGLAAQGKITSDVIYSSLVTNMKELSDQAASMPATISDSFTLLRNSALQMVGVYDQANGISEELANTLVGLSDTIRDIDLEPVVAGFQLLAAVIGVRMVASYAALAKSNAVAIAGSLKATTTFNAQTLAMTRTTVASNAAAVAMRGAGAAMAFMGGPIGLAAVAALTAYSIASYNASQAEKERARIMEGLRKMDSKLNSESGLESQIKNQSETLRSLREEIDLSKAKIQELAALSAQNASISESVNSSIASLWGNIEQKTAKIKQYEDSIAALNEKLAELTGGEKGGVAGLSPNMQKAFDSIEEGYRRQIALGKEATETEKLLYEIQNGRLKGLPSAQQKILTGLTQELDARDKLIKQAEVQKDYNKMMRDMSAGMDANDEINRLNDMYAERQGIINLALETELINKQEHDAAMIALDEATTAERMRITDNYNMSQRQAAVDTMASIVSITKTQVDQLAALGNESSAIGKTFFIMSQTLAAANAVIYGLQASMAIRLAYAQMAAMSGPAAPAILAAGEGHANLAASMGIATGAIIAGRTIAGFKQGGYTGNGGVGDVAGVVHGREFVFDAAATARIGRDNLESMRSGGDAKSGGSNIEINVIEDASKAGTQERQNSNGMDIISIFVSNIKSGGALDKAIRGTYGVHRIGK